MASFWRQILLRVCGSVKHAATTPEKIVNDFIQDYQAWNDRIWAMSKTTRQNNEGHEKVHARAESDYIKLVAKYYAVDVVPQPISFGSDSMHQLARELIQTVEVSGHTAMVRTKSTDDHNFVCDYEYQLVKEAGQWRIKSLLYVTEEGRYECL
jgi:hypothetical protein